MPSLDKLASLSRRMKETSIVVQPGGGQEGTEDGQAMAATASSSETQRSTERQPLSADHSVRGSSHYQNSSNGQMASMDTSSLEAATLSVRDAVHAVASEIRLLRTEGKTGGGATGADLASLESRMALLTDEVSSLREQLEVQAIQLAEILKLLR